MASHNILDRQEADSPLEIGHKAQHSHDSGAYIDWNMDESYANYVGSKINDPATYNSNVSGGFVTVVAVEQNPSMEKPPCPFVTVLAINDGDPQSTETEAPKENGGAELVLLYRLPGERLGLGLKFEGGVKSSEKVEKLFIQSCAPNSPASRSKASWGFLAAGDEILAIDEIPVNSMTRIECVRCLKESSVVIKLLIKPNHSAQRPSSGDKDSAEPFVMSESLPPPVPPRKFRKNSLQSGSNISEALSNVSLLVHPPEDFADRSIVEPSPCHKCKASPKALPRHTFPGHLESGDTQEAQIYTDLFAGDDTEVTVIESESDDTGSSMSTVIDRASSGPTTSNSSFSEVRSTTSAEAAFDVSRVPNSTCSTVYLDRVLEPFLQLEREFSSSAVIEDSTLFTKLVAAASIADGKSNPLPKEDNLPDPSQISLQPPVSFQDLQLDLEATKVASPRRNNVTCITTESVEEEAPVLPPKPLPRKDIQTQNQKGKFKSGKKRPPPPPPPPFKSDRPLPVPDPPSEDAKEEEGFSDVDHLPRLIDFVPKDRTDVIVPNAIHASAKHQDHVEMLIERHKFLDIISTPNECRGSVKDLSASSASTDPGNVMQNVPEQTSLTVDELPPSGQPAFEPSSVSCNNDQSAVRHLTKFVRQGWKGKQLFPLLSLSHKFDQAAGRERWEISEIGTARDSDDGNDNGRVELKRAAFKCD